jgi:hypothetical protein
MESKAIKKPEGITDDDIKAAYASLGNAEPVRLMPSL